MSNNLTKSQATKLGKVLLARMEGRGWKLRVWENLGWHYAVETEYLSVREYLEYGGRYRFCCILSARAWGSVAWASDPNKAVKKVMRNARARLTWYSETLANANKVYA